MPLVSVKGDRLSTGHICVSTTTLASPGQTSVRVNNIAVARITDPTVSHPFPPDIPPCGSHASTVKTGSRTVNIAGRKCARVGDAADSGALLSKLGNVFAGG